MPHSLRILPIVALLIAVLTGCGGSSSQKTTSSASNSNSGTSGTSNSGTQAPLSADAKSAATGDIPDTQNFLTFSDKTLGFSMSYPEGWAQLQSKSGVSFQDKNNLVRVSIKSGATPTLASVAREIAALQSASPSLKSSPPQNVTINKRSVIKTTYTTQSAPNPVTGKTVTLMVDRYELSHNGKVATVELGTPTGVDNVDAYKKMIASFTWL